MTFCQLERNRKEHLSPFIKVIYAYAAERSEGSQNPRSATQKLKVYPVTVAERYSLSLFGGRDRGFKSHKSRGCFVCICVYSVFVVELIPRPRSPPSCVQIEKLK
jgi:hypothetical protein